MPFAEACILTRGGVRGVRGTAGDLVHALTAESRPAAAFVVVVRRLRARAVADARAWQRRASAVHGILET